MKEVRWIRIPSWEQLPDIGLYMDQVITFMDRTFERSLPKGETTRSMINNYVKGKLIPRPTAKKYSREHLARLLMVILLKQALNMESVGEVLDLLCREGIEAGYERFRCCFDETERSVCSGHVEMDWRKESPEELILRFSIMAGICTIRTHWMLQQEEKQEIKK